MPLTPPTTEEAPASAPSVSHEKEKIFAPPRSAVPRPDARSVFGAGFFRRLRASPGAGFLFLFLGIGSGIFLFGVAGTFGPYKEGLRENGDPRFFLAMMAFGTVFSLVALRILQLMLTGAANQERERGSQAKPWTWDYPWRQDWMPPDYSGGGSGTVLGRVAFLALLGMFNVAWASPSWIFKTIVSVFDLLGLLILYDSFQKVYQWLRFRRPVVIWTTLPAFLEERLAGRIAFARRVRATGPPNLTLRCVRDEWTDTGTGEEHRRELQPHAIYRQTQEIPLPGAPGEPLDAIDFSFELPSGKGTDLAQERPIYWQLMVNVPLPGPNLEVVFLAPVYQRR